MTTPATQRRPLAAILRTCLHESGHAVAAESLGFEVIEVSAAGYCKTRTQADGIPAPSFEQSASVLLWPMQTRQWFEHRYALTVAGPIAAAIYAVDADAGYRVASAAELERDQLAAAVDQGADRGRKDPPSPLTSRSDDEIGAELLKLGAGDPDPAVGVAYASYLHAVVVAWIRSEVFCRQLAGVVRELLLHETISGAHLRQTLERIRAEIMEEVGK